MKRSIELLPLFRERIWGRKSLEPYFPAVANQPNTESIGEAWFTFRDNQTSEKINLGSLLDEHPEILGSGADPRHPGVCPILVKLLFTTERLSVQVHPGDDYARHHHECLGKTEAWYVLHAEPGGEIAVGFKETLDKERFRNAIESGEIEHLLDWRPAQSGDIIFVPAGTVHAIGAGLTICEIQENSDLTYRLYDYGRPRELHLEHGAEVSHLGPYTESPDQVQLSPGRDQLLGCPYFRIERLRPSKQVLFEESLPCYSILICTAGEGILDGKPCRAGQSWLVPAGSEGLELHGEGAEWIWTYSAETAASNVQVA